MVSTIYIPMATNRKVENLLTKKRDVERELKVIRDLCKHEKKVLRLVPLKASPSQVDTRWVCERCDIPLGYPNQEEIKKFLSK
jgi:hypothetical protein